MGKLACRVRSYSMQSGNFVLSVMEVMLSVMKV